MTKTALLIGAPGGITSRYLHGVQHDLKDFKRFLQSPQGGGWLDEEIMEFADPTLEQLNNTFSSLHADYTIVYVSGDGSTDAYGRRLAHLANGDTFADTDFLNLNSGGLLVIMDTDRKAHEDGPKYIPLWHTFTDAQLKFARKKYDQWVAKCKGGSVIIHASDHIHPANDSAQGGSFTNALLFFGNGLKPGKSHCTYASIKRIGECTINMVRRHEGPQKPYMPFINGNARLPFAMGVPEKVPVKKRVKSVPKKAGTKSSSALLLNTLLAGLSLLRDEDKAEE